MIKIWSDIAWDDYCKFAGQSRLFLSPALSCKLIDNVRAVQPLTC